MKIIDTKSIPPAQTLKGKPSKVPELLKTIPKGQTGTIEDTDKDYKIATVRSYIEKQHKQRQTQNTIHHTRRQNLMATQQCKTCEKSMQKWGYKCRTHETGKKTTMTQRINDQWNAKKSLLPKLLQNIQKNKISQLTGRTLFFTFV